MVSYGFARKFMMDDVKAFYAKNEICAKDRIFQAPHIKAGEAIETAPQTLVFLHLPSIFKVVLDY